MLVIIANREDPDQCASLFFLSKERDGHVEHSSGAVRTACDIQIEGRREAGMPKLTWKKLMEKDCHVHG